MWSLVSFAILVMASLVSGQVSLSTYLGGNSEDIVNGLATTATLTLSVGSTKSTNLPVTGTPISAALKGGQDGFISIRTNTAAQFSTYFGGEAADVLNAVATDATGNYAVVGWSSSNDFPLAGNIFQAYLNGTQDAVISYFSSANTLLWSTYLGGTAEEEATSVAFGSNGNVYVTGWTSSSNFPVTNGASNTGAIGAFVAVFDPTGNLLFSTLISGDLQSTTTASSIIVGTTDFFVGGRTDAATIRGSSNVNGVAGFICAFESNYNFRYISLIGGTGVDAVTGLALGANNVYATGYTSSSDFPTSLNAFQSTRGGGVNDAFLVAITRVAGISVFSTYLGGNGNDQAFSISTDQSENVWVCGTTRSTNFAVTTNSFVATLRDSTGQLSDAFVTAFTPTGARLFSTLYGGNGNDVATSIRPLGTGFIVAGWTLSTNFPTVASSQNTIGGSYDGFLFGGVPGNTPSANTIPGSNANTDNIFYGKSESRAGAIAGLVLGLLFGLLCCIGVLFLGVWFFEKSKDDYRLKN